MTSPYTILTYPEAIQRMRANGYLFDVGQIEPGVLRQLHWAANRGDLRRTKDSWPMRDFAGDGQEMRDCFELRGG